MAINLFRFDPSKWLNAIDETLKESDLLKKYKYGKNLIEIVKNTQSQVPISIDDVANEACRANNRAVVAKAEATPTRGGNIAEYKAKTPGQQSDGSSEYTFVKYEDSSPIKFVILVMALMYEQD